MEKLIRLVDEQMRQVLSSACEFNERLHLIRQAEGDSAPLRTRFLSLLESGLIAIETPVRGGVPVAIRADEHLLIKFNLHEQPYQFFSLAQGREMMSLSQDIQVPALTLQQPNFIERIQRRTCFRVKLSANRRKPAHLWLLQQVPNEDRLTARPLGLVELCDLSVGGAGIAILQSQAELLAIDAETIIALPLQEPRSFLRLQGVVRSARPTADGICHVGLQFLGLDETPEGRALKQQLEYHVAALERDELQRLKRKV